MIRIPARDNLVVPHQALTIRWAIPSDLPAMVEIHERAFDKFFLTQLGTEFLRRYYALVLNYSQRIILVGEACGSLKGFVCGFLEPSKFYRSMWQRGATFVAPALTALVRRPLLARRIVYAVQRLHTSASGGAVRCCELSSIAVIPEASGNGLGTSLLLAFVGHAKAMGAEYVFLNTDADENDQANALYERAGFQRTQRFLQRKGRWMNEYVMDRLPMKECAEYGLE